MKLSDFDHLRTDKRVRFKEEIINGVSVTIVAYMIADAQFWEIPLAKETRGPVFDTETGECICRPFEKFFNVGERPETQLGLIDFINADIFEKRDGSMITPVMVGGQLAFKTKKSFSSDVALEAAQVASRDVRELSMELISKGITPIFEYTSPNWKIVIDYGQVPAFTLLAARRMEDGRYMGIEELFGFADFYRLPLIESYPMLGREEVLYIIATRSNFEGFVISQHNGTRVKLKTNWYLINHRLMTTLRDRDVALAVVDETVDDIKSELSLENKDLTPILAIEIQVIEELRMIVEETELLYAKLKAQRTRKEAALLYSHFPYFALAMKMYDNKEPRYVDYWKRFFLDDYPLHCIYNQNFSQKEGE